MRTKTLLLTAALSAAGVAASMAQVYSVNVVGYVNYTVPGSKLALLANPLMNSTNSINQVLALADGSDAFVYQFNPVTQAFKDPVTFYSGFGWYSASDANPTLTPGEGFFILNNLATPLNITFVGEVMQSSQYTLTVPVTGGSKLSLLGSQVPQAARLGTNGWAGTLQFAANADDLVFVWDLANQTYKNPYTYYDNYGWYSADDADTQGPLINPGDGFWVFKAAANCNWTRTWNVQ